MATYYWVSTSGNPNSSASWSATSGGAGGAGVPTTGDIIIFDRGNQSVNTAITTPMTVATCHVRDGYGGTTPNVTIGTDANAWALAVTGSLIVDNRRIMYTKLNGAIASAQLAAFRMFYLAGGSAVDVILGSEGWFQAEDDVEITNLESDGANGLIKADATTPLDMSITLARGSRFEVQRLVASADIDGELILSEGANTANTGKITVNAGGRLILNQSGSLLGASANGGFIKAKRGSTIDASNGSFAHSIAYLIRSAGARISLPADRITITATQWVGKNAPIEATPL